MNILNDKLLDGNRSEHYTPGNHIGRDITPKYVIIHATATASPFEDNVAAFTQEHCDTSIHLLIGRDGEYHQFVPFKKAAAHCGSSRWEGLMSINNHSIGIELLNAAFLSKNQQGEFYKTGYLRDYIIPDTDRTFENNLWWQIFPPAQLNAALEIVKLLFNTYPELKDVLGHNDINTTGNRAGDPGPVFPMQWFHAEVLGLDPNIPISRVYKTSGFSHLYKEPDVNAERIIEGGMPSNIDLGILDEIEGWVFVHVLNYPDNNSVFTGWIQRNRIKQDEDKPRHYHRATENPFPDDYQPKINDWSKFAPI